MTIFLQGKKTRIYIASFVLATIFLLASLLPLKANVSTPIVGSIRLSVCGDGIVEGNEQCEPMFEEVFECSEIGLYTGETKCDISCEFDLFKCSPIIPPGPQEDPDEQGEAITPPTQVLPPSTINVIIEDISIYIKHLLLPEVYREYDVDRNGKLSSNEYLEAIRTWVDSWKYFNIDYPIVSGTNRCDLNSDGICNVVDLSILLYYSE